MDHDIVVIIVRILELRSGSVKTGENEAALQTKVLSIEAKIEEIAKRKPDEFDYNRALEETAGACPGAGQSTTANFQCNRPLHATNTSNDKANAKATARALMRSSLQNQCTMPTSKIQPAAKNRISKEIIRANIGNILWSNARWGGGRSGLLGKVRD